MPLLCVNTGEGDCPQGGIEMKDIRSLSEWDSNGWHVTSPAPRDVWEAILKSDPDAQVYQSPAWLDCVCAMGVYEDASCL